MDREKSFKQLGGSMKILLTLLLVFSFARIAFADTYEKEDDYTLKVTVTSSTETVSTYTRPQLLTERARKLEEITSNYNNYISRDTSLKADLADIDKRISEAVKLSIKENAEVAEPK